MEEVTEQEKKTLLQKLHQFQINGLESYGKYLQDQLVYASQSEIRKAYKKYIENQIELNDTRIKDLNAKLNV